MDQGRRVLIVEDNATNMQLAVFLLEASGFMVDAATSMMCSFFSALMRTPERAVVLEQPNLSGIQSAQVI